MRLWIASVVVLGLTACVPEEDAMSGDTGDDTCGAAALQHLVGTEASAFDFGALDSPVRIIPPNSAVTMDHRPDRLNVQTDADGVIEKITCG